MFVIMFFSVLRFGRRLTFLVCAVLHITLGITVIFSPGYIAFTIQWFLVAAGTAGAHNAAYILRKVANISSISKHYYCLAEAL